AVHRDQRAERLAQALCFEKRHASSLCQASTTPPRRKSTTITKAMPSSIGQRAHTVLMDSESQMKTTEPITGPYSEPEPPISVANTTFPEVTKLSDSSGT